MSNLPDSFSPLGEGPRPVQLRQAWAIGAKAGYYTEGPFYSPMDALYCIGETGDKIFECLSNRPIYEWNDQSQKWVKCKEILLG